jgi:hypothetical protein
VRLVLKLKSDRNGQVYVKTAAHMRLDRRGRLLLYDASHRLMDEISLVDHSVEQILPVHWVREDVDLSRETAPPQSAQAKKCRPGFESAFTVRVAISSAQIADIPS